MPQDFMTLFLAVAIGIALGAPVGYVLIQRIRDHHHQSLRGRFDSTDAASASDRPGDYTLRSGLKLYIDHGTGVHYVGNDTGGLTPRLLENGDLVTSGRLSDRQPHPDTASGKAA